MNIEAMPRGTNFSVEAWGPDMPPWAMSSFSTAYRDGGDETLEIWEFERLVRAANILCFALRNDGWVHAQFGVQLMVEKRSRRPYLQIAFFKSNVRRLNLARAAPVITKALYQTAMQHKYHERFDGEMRLRLVGRRGWRVVLRRMGIKIDKFGWISEKAFTSWA